MKTSRFVNGLMVGAVLLGACAAPAAPAAVEPAAPTAAPVAVAEGKKMEIFSWWTNGGEADGLNEMFKIFTAKNPDTEIINATVAGGAGTNAKTVLKTRLQGGQPPDTWQVHAGKELVEQLSGRSRRHAGARGPWKRVAHPYDAPFPRRGINRGPGRSCGRRHRQDHPTGHCDANRRMGAACAQAGVGLGATEAGVADRRAGGVQPERFFAVTSISIFMRGSARPAWNIVAAGRTAPKRSRSTGQHASKSAATGRM